MARLFKQQGRTHQRPRRRLLSLDRLEERIAPVADMWTGGGGNSNWNTPTNWNNGIPTAGAVLSFPAGAAQFNTTDNITGLSVSSISISSSNYDFLAGSQLTLTGNVTVGAGDTNETMALSIALTGPSTWTVNGGASLTMTGQLSGPGAPP